MLYILLALNTEIEELVWIFMMKMGSLEMKHY